MTGPAVSSGSALGPGPVIVGVDGSGNSLGALDVAVHLARRLDLELVVFHAVGLMTVIDGRHVPSEGRRDELEQLLREEWCATLADDHQVRWRAELVDGSPADVVMKMATELDASLVVVGSRGVGDEQVLGSTSHHVVHHSNRPVLVVPPGGVRSRDV